MNNQIITKKSAKDSFLRKWSLFGLSIAIIVIIAVIILISFDGNSGVFLVFALALMFLVFLNNSLYSYNN